MSAPLLEFSDARAMLRWGREEISTWRAAKDRVLALSALGREIVEVCGSPPTYDVYITGIKPNEDDALRRSTHRILNDLRHSLDVATFAASTLINGCDINEKQALKISFPYSASSNGFEGIMQRSGIPASLKPYFTKRALSHKSSVEDDRVLLGLLKLSNPNKHRTPLKVGTSGAIQDVSAIRGVRNFESNRGPVIDGRMRFLTFQPDGCGEFFIDASPNIFTYVELPLMARDVESCSMEAGRFFAKAADLVGTEIDNLEAECARILADANTC